MLFCLTEASLVLLALDTNVGLNEDYPQAIAAWKTYAKSKFPEEACAFIDADGKLMPVDNIHEKPEESFEVSHKDYLKAGGAVGFLHSHTQVEAQDITRQTMIREHPSDIDMKTQMSMGIPWGISTCTGEDASDPIWWGDSLPIRPLVGRPFVWGINDCYSLVRDWHRLQGIEIPDYPRDIGFWIADEDGPAVSMYDDFFKEAGFERVYREDGPIPGDCFICCILSNVRNHAGVYIGNGQIVHHTMDRLSKRDPANVWQSKMDFLVRHKDLPEDAKLKDVINAT